MAERRADTGVPPGRLRYDNNISLGHILTTGVIVIGVVAGYVRLEAQVAQNTRSILETERVIDGNRNLQMKQQERVWERMNRVQEQSNEVKSATRELKVKMDYIAQQVDRLVAGLISRSLPQQ